MPASIVTTDDLREFKSELLAELSNLLVETNRIAGPKQWLRSSEARELLNISSGTLHTMRINGTLSFTKVGRLIYYNYDEIKKLIQDNQVNYQKEKGQPYELH
ncbi:MAG: helix-turn-helix domain-containing protein [Bacteroidota bacterium]|nr:helix-turn-helix domain-containing protein [Bacteroidota bacterium]